MDYRYLMAHNGGWGRIIRSPRAGLHSNNSRVQTLCTVGCTLHNLHCTFYCIQCILYSVLYTVHTVHCTIYTVNCSAYSAHYCWYMQMVGLAIAATLNRATTLQCTALQCTALHCNLDILFPCQQETSCDSKWG